MNKVFFFEREGGRVHKCLFAGLDNSGMPQWIMVDQGDEMMTLEEYMKCNLLKNEDMRVLCLEGEKLESVTMAMLLGAVLQGYPCDIVGALSEAVATVRHMGFEWRREKVKMRVHMREYFDDVVNARCFCFEAYCGCGMEIENDCFKTPEDMLKTLQSYYDVMNVEAGIDLEVIGYTDIEDLQDHMDQENVAMFSKIYYEEK